MTNLEVIRRYWEVMWGGAEAALVDDLFAEPCIRHNRNGTDVVTPEQLKASFNRYWSSFGVAPEVRIDGIVEAGDHVWSRVTVRGWDGDQGDARVVTFFHQARLRNGRIVETWSLAAAEVDWLMK